jgi:hypothetical protein
LDAQTSQSELCLADAVQQLDAGEETSVDQDEKVSPDA